MAVEEVPFPVRSLLHCTPKNFSSVPSFDIPTSSDDLDQVLRGQAVSETEPGPLLCDTAAMLDAIEVASSPPPTTARLRCSFST